MTNKSYVLDTSVLISNPNVLFELKGSKIYIPIEVLEELDNIKIRMNQAGVSARKVNRTLDEIKGRGSLLKGVTLDSGQIVKVIALPEGTKMPTGLSDTTDNRVILSAYMLNKKVPDVICLSNDIALRVKCDALGIASDSYNKGTDASKERFLGVTTIDVPHASIEELFEDGKIVLGDKGLYPNQGVLLQSSEGSALGMANVNGEIERLKHTSVKNFNCEGITPRSKEQTIALELLLDPDIHMVSMVGKAGCGKTLLAIASAMNHLFNKRYSKVIVSRPAQSMSKDIGFLPGPQPLDAKVLTPDGWVQMGDIKKGSKVITRKGISSEVIEIFPKGKKEVYRITTSDGRVTEACADHLWFTKTLRDKKNNKNGSIKTTIEILETLRDNKFKNRLNHFLPRNNPVVYTTSELDVPAYTLGVLLGDGTFGNSISLYNKDCEIVNRFRSEIRDAGFSLLENPKRDVYTVTDNPKSNKPSKKVFVYDERIKLTQVFSGVKEASEVLGVNRTTINSRCENECMIDGKRYYFGEKESRWGNRFKQRIDDLGLLFVTAENKFIPEDYLYKTSVDERISLLRGLMDSDGSVKKSTGEATFYTCSERLAVDIQELVRSLGGNANIQSKRPLRNSEINGRLIKANHEGYCVSVSLLGINPFYTSKKADFYSKKYLKGIKIESIEPIGEKEVQCILIDDDEHLYITDDFIVTHNTKEEKMAPWIQPIFDNLEVIFSKKGRHYFQSMMDKGQLEIEALSHVRGRTLPNTIFIIDEAQNITHHEAKAVLTRMGENSKIILIGDLEQIDSTSIGSDTSGLASVVNLFKEFEHSGHVELLKGERSALAAYAAKVM